ncbi:class 1 fructose-bisphosphatase, partial [Okeania hirsuta]
MVNTQENLHIRLEETQALDRDCTTLSRHVLQQLQFSPDAQDISALMNRIALAGKLIARRLTR